MIKFLFLTIPSKLTYDDLKQKLEFPQDASGVSNWVMKFPLSIYSADLKQKHVFTEGKVEVSSTAGINLQQKWKYFVMTRSDGSRCYCTYHIFYVCKKVTQQKGPLVQKKNSLFSSFKASRLLYQDFYLPKCLILMSEKPYFKLMTNLVKIYNELRKNNPYITNSVNSYMFNAYENLVSRKRQQEWPGLSIQPNGRNINSPIEVAFDYYIALSNSPRAGEKIFVSSEKKMEILHLYTINGSLYNFNYFFHLPISGQTLSRTIAAMLQEKQIIFTSYNQNSILMLMETLLQIIQPFKWNHMYVPNLPEHMIQVAEESFMPYMIGISKKILSKIDLTCRVVVYVDSNELEYLHQEDKLLDLPRYMENYLAYECNPSNPKYLEWEKEVRIKSIMMMTTLLARIEDYQRAKKSSGLGKKLHTSIVRRMISQQQHSPVFSHENIPRNNSLGSTVSDSFYQHFTTKTGLFHQYIETSQLRPQQVHYQIEQLLKIPNDQRLQVIMHKFYFLFIQVSYPALYDNQKEWTKYYYQYVQKNRRVKDFRQSLASHFSVSVYNSVLVSTNDSVLLGENKVYNRLEDNCQRAQHESVQMRKTLKPNINKKIVLSKRGLEVAQSMIKL